MKTITVGSLRLALPAFITLVCGVIMSIGLMITNPTMWVTSLLIMAVFIIAAYNVNCAIVGKCNAWAWVLVSVYIVYTIAVLIIFYLRDQVITSFMPKSKK